MHSAHANARQKAQKQDQRQAGFRVKGRNDQKYHRQKGDAINISAPLVQLLRNPIPQRQHQNSHHKNRRHDQVALPLPPHHVFHVIQQDHLHHAHRHAIKKEHEQAKHERLVLPHRQKALHIIQRHMRYLRQLALLRAKKRDEQRNGNERSEHNAHLQHFIGVGWVKAAHHHQRQGKSNQAARDGKEHPHTGQ